MSLLDGDKPSSLPSLSWDSVTGDKPSTQPSPDQGEQSEQHEAPSPPAPPTSAAPASVPSPPAPAPAPAPPPVEDPTGPIHLDVKMDPAPSDGVGQGLLGVTPPEPVAEPLSPASPPPAPAAGLASFTMSLDRGIAASVPAESATGGVAPPVISAPTIDTAPPASPSPLPTSPADVPAPPTTVEQAPAAAAVTAPPAPVTNATPAAAPAPAPQPAAPAPAVPAYTLPPVQAQSVPVASVGRQISYEAPPAGSRKRRRHQHRGGGGLGLLLTLLVLGGLIAAAFVYGRPYLFPDDWDATTKPHADAVEAVRGESIVEPFTVVDEELAVYAAGFDADYFGEWETDVALWRAFGLIDGATTTASLAGQVTERPEVYYSLTDRQVHRVATADAVATDPATTAAVAAAVLDQEYRWTLLLGDSTIERDALVRALVTTEADRIQASSEVGGTLPPATTTQVGLPVLLDHRLVAPTLYAAIIGQPDAADESRMAELESFASQMSGSSDLPLGTPAILGEGEAPAGTALAMDRSFWYLAFASRMEPAIAHDFSQALQSASLTAIRTADATTCWGAVFDVPTPDLGFSLATSLSEWAAAAPPATAASVTAVSETAVQLRVCDPGVAAATTNATGARSLLGYRAAELAVIAGIVELGGGPLEIDAGLTLLAQSTVGDELATVAVSADMNAVAADAVARAVPIVDAATAGLPAAAPEPAPTVGDAPVSSDEG